MPNPDETDTPASGTAALPTGTTTLDLEGTSVDQVYVWEIAGEATDGYYAAINNGLAPALVWGAFVLGLKGNTTAIQYIARIEDKIGMGGISDKLLDFGTRSGTIRLDALPPNPPPPPPPVAGGGSGPHDPGMEPRVAALEADMKDVKASLKELEHSSVRIEAILSTLATREDTARSAGETKLVAEAVNGLGNRVGLVESGLSGLGSKVDSKLISGGQMFLIFGGLMTLFLALSGALIGVLHWAGFLPR